MDIALTGSTGLIGTALAASLRSRGHRVVPVTRSGSAGDAIGWDPAAGTIDAKALEGLDAVIHLAGEPIAARPWTDQQKRRIHDSRQDSTRLLASTLAGLERPPAVLLSGSAVGAYGDRGDEQLTESSTLGHDFLADVCRDWEAATAPAVGAGVRVAHLRSGIVLDAKGGALAKQVPLFKAGLGGRAGDGRQWLPWITLDDEVSAIGHLLVHDVAGPVNLVAPGVVTNAAFTKALGQALHRPTVVPVPRFVRHLPAGVGELLGSLLFTSARVVPEVLDGSGFTFAHPDLDEALASVLGPR